MRNVFASKQGDVTVCAMDVFLYCADSKVSEA